MLQSNTLRKSVLLSYPRPTSTGSLPSVPHASPECTRPLPVRTSAQRRCCNETLAGDLLSWAHVEFCSPPAEPTSQYCEKHSPANRCFPRSSCKRNANLAYEALLWVDHPQGSAAVHSVHRPKRSGRMERRPLTCPPSCLPRGLFLGHLGFQASNELAAGHQRCKCFSGASRSSLRLLRAVSWCFVRFKIVSPCKIAWRYMTAAASCVRLC